MRTIGLFLSFSFFLLSCSKEDIQPSGTFQTFRKKLIGSWNLTESSTNGNPDNIAGFTVEMSFEKNGYYSQSVVVDVGGSLMTYNDTGNWYITDNQTTLVVSSNSNGTMSSAAITKLTGTELVLTDSSSGDTIIQTYEKQ